MIINKGELHIWRYELNEKDCIAEEKNPILSNFEKERFRRFINKKDAMIYVCNHRFMRNVLSLYLNVLPENIKLEYSVYGKPFIKDNVYFNLSYRNQYGIFAISLDNEVGIDIEEIRNINDIKNFTQLYFSDNEQKIIFSTDKMEILKKVFHFWTLKEALIKAQAKFISMDLFNIDLSKAQGFEFLNYIDKDNQCFSLKRVDSDEKYCAAIACKGIINRHTEFNYQSI